MGRRRLDSELVRRGLVASRETAHQLILRGAVTVAGAPAEKPSRLVDSNEPIAVLAPVSRFVSRGGDKLDAALDRFGVDVRGRRALDAGASTGGFTDCLLQRGAARVIAVDVGHGQLHPKIRQDPRVEVHERLNIRSVDATTFGAPVDVTVADLSFISLTTVAGALLAVTDLGCPLVLLVKPQFEVGRVEASRARGVITDPELHEQARERVGRAYETAGAAIMGWMESPLRGAEGNVEFFVHLERVR